MAQIDVEPGLVYAWWLDGRGGARQITFAELREVAESHEGTVWAHLDLAAPEAQRFVRDEAGFDPWVADALLTPQSRPRVLVHEQGILASLRGVNLNEGKDPEDMVSLRLWIERGWVISLRTERLRAVVSLRESLEAGRGPDDSSGVLRFLLGDLVGRASQVVEQVEDGVDEIEGRVWKQTELRGLSAEIADLRRTCMGLRRYLRPQRDAVAEVVAGCTPWLSDADAARIRETVEHYSRLVETLETLRDELAVSQDEVNARADERVNSRLYVLALISAVFLPLGFLTGLFGMNLGGLPGLDSPLGFWIALVGMVGIALGIVAAMRRVGWF